MRAISTSWGNGKIIWILQITVQIRLLSLIHVWRSYYSSQGRHVENQPLQYTFNPHTPSRLDAMTLTISMKAPKPEDQKRRRR